MRFRLLQIATGVLLGLAVVAIVFTLTPPTSGPMEWDGSEVHPDPYPAPALTLRNTRAHPVSLDAFRGEVTLVFFGFTNCPDVCPITMLNWTRALSLLEEEGASFQGILVSIDPGRDTPEVLDRYMAHFHPSIVALTGTRAELARAADDWGVLALVHEPEEGGAPDPHAGHGPSPVPVDSLPEVSDPQGYGVDHSSRSFVIDRRGRVVRTLAPFLDAESIVEALRPFLR
jgi:protein SCO1